MTFLVDANILSEGTKPQPHQGVLEWLRLHEREIVVDPIILGEVRFGILLLPAGKKRRELESWFKTGIQNLVCLPWEAETALHWSTLLAKLRRVGLSMPIKDSMIAATALTHDLTIVTRNGRDFKKAGLTVVNPFDEKS